jgi:hypothetical protein
VNFSHASTLGQGTARQIATLDHADMRGFLPDAGALSHTTNAIKEYIGYAYYRWKGWITG